MNISSHDDIRAFKNGNKFSFQDFTKHLKYSLLATNSSDGYIFLFFSFFVFNKFFIS